jgi:hypothetical protein
MKPEGAGSPETQVRIYQSKRSNISAEAQILNYHTPCKHFWDGSNSDLVDGL